MNPNTYRTIACVGGSNPTDNPKCRKVTRPGKPYPSFPLSAHRNGQWYVTKRIGGAKHFFYFGRWADDPTGQNAHQAYLAVASDIRAGRAPRAENKLRAISCGEVVSRWLEYCEGRVRSREIGVREFDDIRLACLFHFLDAAGEDFPANSLAAPQRQANGTESSRLDLFQRHLDARMGAYAFNRNVTKVRAMLKWAYKKASLIDRPLNEEDALRNKKARIARRQRRLRDGTVGAPVFEPRECISVVKAAKDKRSDGRTTDALLPIILVMLNSGWGNSQVADLPLSVVLKALETGLVDWVRVKTEEIAQFPLWDVTAQAIRDYLPRRPEPRDRADDDILFLTRWGRRWVQEYVAVDEDGKLGAVSPDDAIGKAINKLQRSIGIKRPGRNAYSFRHTFAMLAGELPDDIARRRIMGHSFQGMDPHYLRGQFGIERLRAITDHVYHRLFGACAVPTSVARNSAIVRAAPPVSFPPVAREAV